MSGRVLVTGATGFIGRHLCRELLSNGWSVTAVRRETSDVGPLEGLDLEWAYADVLDREAVRDAVPGHDQVVHLAGVGLLDADETTVRKVNVEGTRHVLDACTDAGVERVVFAATAGTLRRDDGPATEADEARPVGAYQASKARAERLVEEYARHHDAVTVHPTSAFGPGDEGFTAKLLWLATTPIPVYLPGGASIVDVRDVATGIRKAMERGTSGEHYLLGGENLTFGEALSVVADAAGGSRPPLRVPPALVRAAGPVAGVVNATLGTRMFPVNGAMARLSTRRLFHDSGKAERELGYDYRPLAAQVDRAVEWYRTGSLPQQDVPEDTPTVS